MNLRPLVSLAALTFLGCAASSTDSGQGGGSAHGSDDALTTTTASALLANNTSASSLFVDSYTPATRFHGGSKPLSNNDAAPGSIASSSLAVGRVSKVSIHKLVSIPVFAETQSWFCTNGKSPLGSASSDDQCGGHIDIGYATNTTARVKQQVADMRARGLDGAIIDWQGSSTGVGIVDEHTTSVAAINNGAVGVFKEEAEASNGAFKFAVTEDEGIRACSGQKGCDVNAALVSQINFANTHYFSSPGYLKKDGRPVLFFFGVDHTVDSDGKSIDWSYVRSHVAGNPLFIFENSGGFSHAHSDGAYAWVKPTAIGSYPGSDPFDVKSALPDFYAKAKSHPSLQAWGGAFKGFDDAVVNGWGGGRRYLGQQCGKTWLDSLAAAEAQAAHLDAVQLPTWDDYEEGTELETGIDNHVAVSGSLAGTTLAIHLAAEAGAPADCTSAIAGGLDLATTLDHFVVYASTDGAELELVADQVAPTTKSIDLAGKIPSGMKQLFVYAVGKSMIHNHLSSSIAIGKSSSSSSSGGGESCGVPTILEPTGGENVGPAIRLRVAAPACIETMIAYIDGDKAVTIKGNTIDQWVNVSMGQHRLNVNGWAGTDEAHVSESIEFTRTY